MDVTVNERQPEERRRSDRRAPATRMGAPEALVIDDRQKLVQVRGRKVRLTPKEFNMLNLLASEPGRVFSVAEIIKAAWERNSRASTEDVQQYIHLLRKKIEANPRQPQLIVTVHGFGYGLELPS